MARFKNRARLLVPASLLLVGLLLSTPSLTSCSTAYEALTQNVKISPLPNENRGSAVPDALVTTLGEIYDDKTRAQEDLEALYEAGIIDGNGKLSGLDLREDGKSVGLSELTKRIASGEKVGDITVNGKPATSEQVMKISQVNAAIEIAELLKSDIDVTDDHVENLEALLRGIQNGSIDLRDSLKTGTLQLSGNTVNDSDTQDNTDYSLPETIPTNLSFTQDGESFYGPYVSGSTYQRNYPFFHPFHDPAYDDYFTWYENAMPKPNAGESGGVSPNTRRDMFDWSKAIIGIDDNRVTPTVTAVLPLKSDDFVQNIIATDDQNHRLTDISKNGIGMEMELPTYGKVNLKLYFNYMFFQYDGDERDFYGNTGLQRGGNREDHGCIRMPAYLVEDESTGRFVAVATRYMAPTGNTLIPNLNTLRLYVDPMGNPAVYSSTEYPKPYIGSWEKSYVDDLGNHYWDMVDYAKREELVAAEGDYTKNIVIPGRCLWYFVPPIITLTTELYKTRPEGSWTQAKHGFIKLENPENPDFPYVYPNDLDHPERQHDAELMVTEQLYDSYAQAEAKDDSWVAPIYLGDNDLRIAIRISDRWDFSRAPDGQMLDRIRWVDDDLHGYEDLTPEDFTVETTCNDGLYILTITPEKVTSPDRYLDHSNRAMLGLWPYVIGNYYLGIPIHMRVCEADPFLSVPKSSQIRQTTEGLKLCSELYERHVLGYNDSEVNLRYDDCNPFGLLAGDFGEISNEPGKHAGAGSRALISEINSLGQLFDGFLGQFDLPSDGTEFVPSLSGEDLNRYNAFYNKAMEIYDIYSLVSFAKNANHDLSNSALLGLSHPFTMTFGNNANVDFQAVIAKLFGFASKTEFQNYAKNLGEYTKTKGLSGAIAEGTFPSDDVRAIYPIAIKNSHTSPIVAFLFVDNSYRVSIWVNDIDAALSAINFDADHYSNNVVNNDLYCKCALFTTGVGGVEITFSSNLAQHNKIETLYVAQLYKVSGIDRSNLNTLPENAQRIDIEGWGEIPASASDLVSHIVVPSTAFDGPGAYAVTISADYNDGTTTQTFSVIVYIEVKSAPLKIHFEKLPGNYFDKDNVPEIKYNVTNAVESAQIKYTIQGSGDEISEMKDASNGVIPFTPDDFDGLKKAYTITVYAKNYEEQPWSVDSMMVTLYNKDVLELLIKDVAFGEVGGSTGGQAGDGTEKAGSSIEIDNNPKIVDLLDKEGDGKGITISNYDLNALRNDINLQRIISINYGSSVLGTISDRLQWSVKDANGQKSSATSLYNKEGGAYVALKDYASYIPTTDFLIVATDDRGEDAPVTITATHASSGSTRSVEVTVKTLKDKLYLFRFLPKAKTYVHYFNGKGEERELYSNEQGELAVYEPDGIASDIDTLSHIGQETYAGTIPNKDLVSGEKDVVLLQTYPCNNLTLEPISNQTITFLKPDGKPYSGSATLRAGIYKKGIDSPDNFVYCPNYGVRTTDETDTAQILRDDIHVTVKDGKTTLYYDPTQLAADWGLYFGIRYVYEYRIDGYQPGYAIIDPFSKNPTDFIINLQKVKGNASAPQITRQVYQQYLNDSRKTSYSRNVIDSTVNIGISANFPKAVLYTDIALPGESVNVDPTTKYSSYEGADVLKFAFYTAGGKKLTGQTDLVDNAKATQIIDLDQLDSATYFVFPFSKVPMLRSTYVMTNADMKSDGIDDTANHPTSRIKAVFTRGSLNVASINMPFGVTNVANQPSITTKDGGAQSVGKEVRDALRETADLGAIFRSINVNDMIKKGFVFLSNLRGIGGDNLIDLMILPTQDPANFRIIAFVGKNQRGGDDDGDGVSYSFNANDLAEDYGKFMEEMNKSPKDKDDDDGDSELEFNFYGTIVLDARIGVADGKWDITFRGGNVGTNVKGKYEWGQTFFCGPVPAFISFEIGFHADLEVSFGNKDSARAMLLDASLGVSMEAFAGLGFDLSLVALQLGIYGQIGADVDFLLLTPSNAAPSTGTKLTISGEIGIKLKVKILFVSYSKTFASTGFNWTKKWNRYDQIRDYWNDQGYGELFGVTRKGRAYQMLLFADGSAAVAIEGGAELESRDYLELQERAWNNGVNSGRRLLKGANQLTNVLSNAYPHSHPAFTDDGEMFVYVSDNDNAKAVESVASYAVSNGSGFDDKGRIDTSADNVLADLDVVASGTKDNAFAAWVKQVEMPQMERNASISNDDLGMMFNATEVYASAYDGSSWTTTRLTDNFVADMSPAIASYGNKAIVAWRSMYASSMSSSEDITAVFDTENNINYRIYNGTEWTEAKVAYNGSAGSVNAIDCAMLKDGTALLTYTVRTGKDVTSTETFYTVIKADGTILTTGRLTNDNFTDTNAQVTAVNDGNGYFVIGWYSEHDAGKGSTSDYDEDGNASSKEALAHDIRLARIHANGSYDADFPESIGGTTSSGISADFHFSAPADNADLTSVAIVWSQRKVSDVPEDAGKYQLQAVRFYKLGDFIGFTAPTLIAETSKNYTIDRFDAITDASGALHAIILGSDYDNIQGIEVYDSINLDAAARNNLSDNSDAPSNLDILDGEAISSINLAIATFPEISADVVAKTNILDVVPGLTSTIQFVLTNTGSATLSEIKATIASTSQTFAVNLLPNRSMTLLMDYDVPAGAVNDVNYSLEAEGIELGSGTLALNRPDVGISGVSIKREESGQRDIQVFLSNGTNIPLAGSGKTVKVAFYKDAFYEKLIGEEITIPEEDCASIDRGNYFLMHTISVSDLYAGGGEIPDGGINVYVRAYVEGSEEPITSNNEGFVRIESLVERNEGAKLAMDTSLEENDGTYTVTAEIRNHSMLDVNIGIPVAILRDAEGNIIARKNIQDTELEIGKESVVEGLSVTFSANEINGTPVQAEVKNIVPVHFDVNGGTGEYADVYTDLDGHIDLPDNDPLVPNNNPLLFFRGWYDSPRGGNLVTDDSVIYVKTTLYARFTEHEHVYEYSLEDDGKTIKAICVSTADDVCPLEEVGRMASLTIHAPERAEDGYGMPEATITGSTNVFGTPEIVYYVQNEDGSKGKALTKAPVDAGKYWAEFTIEIGKDSVTAHVAYEIPYIEGVAAINAQIPNFVKVSDASALNELGQCSALEAYAWISANADKLNLASYDKRSIVVFNKQYMTRPEGMPEDYPWEYDQNKEYAVCFEYRGNWDVTYYLPDDLTRFLTDGYSEVYIKGTESTSVFGEVNFEKVTTSEELSAVSCTENDALIWIVANLDRYPRAIVVFSGDNDNYYFLSYDNDRGQIHTDQGDSNWPFQMAEWEQKQVFIARPSDVLNPYKTYTITYDANGGNGEIAPGTFYVKSDITIANGSELSKANLAFDSWNTASDGSGDSYKPGDRLELLDNITLYAQFKHSHHWDIAYDESKHTFSASCDSEGCDITISPTLELKAEGKTYDGKGVVSYVCSATWTEENGLPMPSIIYYVGGKRAAEAKNAGTYTALVTLGSHTITLDEFTIAPRPIVIKADDKEMHEGEDEPELTVSYEPTSAAESGLVDGDILDFTITRQEGDLEGTYAITVKMGDNPNYDVQDVRNGTFTILAPLGEVQTIEVNDVTARYGDTGVKIDAKITKGDGSLSYIVKSGDAVIVDENGNLTILKVGTAVITVVASQTATSAKTTKNINVTIQLGAMEVSANDVMASVDGEAHGINVTVNKPASGYVIHYGLAEGTYDLTVSPTLTEAGTLTVYYRVSADNYETVTGSVKLTLSNHAHDYAYSVGTGDKANTITAVCSADGCPLPEHTAILVIHAPSGTIVYNGQAYAATLTDENGLAGGAKILYALKGADGTYGEAFETAPTAAGTYTASITLKGSEIGADHDVTASVTYTIAKKALTVTANASAIVYGDAPKGNGVVYDGFLPGEDEKVLTGEVGYAFNYVQYGNVGTYAITPQGLTSSNYEITFVNGALTVTPKEITVNIDKKTAHYGDGQVTLTGTSDGIVNNDQNVYTLACDVTKTTGVGTYNIVGTDASENYVVTFVGGENAYEVTKRPITLTAEEKTIKMGEALPTYSFKASEALPAEVLTTLKEKTSLSCQGNANAVGKYEIAFAFHSGVTGENVLANYVVTLQEGYLYVLQSVLTDPSSGNTDVEILLDNAADAFDYNVSVAIEVETPTEGSTPTSFDFSKISGQYIDSRSEISKVYSITLYRTETVDGVETKREIQPSDMKQGLNLIIKIEIPENLVGRNFRILHIHSETDIEYVDAANLEIKEGFAYVKVNRLSQFAFVSPKAGGEINHTGWCLGWLVVIFDALLAAYLIVYVILRNKKRLGLVGLGLSGALTVFATIVLILHVCYVSIIGLGLAVAMLICFIVVFIRRKKSGNGGVASNTGRVEPVAEVAQEEATEPENEIPLAPSETASTDDETIEEEDEEDEIVGSVIYRKSFLARLCQGSDSAKGYYSKLKNEALAYSGTDSRLSWDGDSIVSGRTTIAKFAIRRKVLCVYFPLNAEDYGGSTIEVEKPSAAKYAKLPCMCRIDSARKLGQAKRLVAASAKKRGLRKGEVPTRDYKLPYQSTEELESKGLAKKIKNRRK